MEDELDKLAESFHARKYLQLFKSQSQDLRLLNWFAKNGELRAYRDYKIKNRSWNYKIYLYNNGLKISLGLISEDHLSNNTLKNQKHVKYISYFRRKNKKLKYCTDFDLLTVEEIQQKPGVLRYTDDTIVWSDGSYSEGNIFSMSKDNVKNYKKYEKKLIDLLDKLSEIFKTELI